MILRRYGHNVQSVETKFDSKALTEIAFVRDHQVSMPGGIGKDPYPVPAPFAGGVAAPDRFRACHHSIPLSMMDCTICALETSPRLGFSTSGGSAGAFRGRCERAILGAPGLPVLGILPSRTRRPRWSAE